MKIVLFARRNTGMTALSYLVAKGHLVKVITDEDDISWLANSLGSELVNEETMGVFDLVVSVHWDKKIDVKLFNGKPAINVHPCLFKYKGKNPIKTYTTNEDTKGSVAAHYMTDKIDMGEVIHEEFFETQVCGGFADFYNVAFPYYFRTLDAAINKIINATNQ